MFPTFRYNSTASPGTSPEQEATLQAPFTIFIAHQDGDRVGSWRPQAFLQTGRPLRTSGFLLALPPEDLQTLLLLLTFLTPNGYCGANLPQLAQALHLSTGKTRLRLERLLALRWQGQPIVLSHRNELGVETFVPVPGFIPVREEETRSPATPVLKAVPRDVVIEHSRRKYARPRAEVERQIAELNEWKLPETPTESDSPKAQDSETPRSASVTVKRDAFEPLSEPADSPKATVRSQLLDVGLLPEQADELLARFALLRIQRQLMWLPHRSARNRAGFLLAAVKDDYAAPTSLFRRDIEPNQTLPPPQSAPSAEISPIAVQEEPALQIESSQSCDASQA